MKINSVDIVNYFNSLNPSKSIGIDGKNLVKTPANLKKQRVLDNTIAKAAYWASCNSIQEYNKYTETELKKICKKYLYDNIDYKSLYMPSGFIEPFTWSAIVGFIVKWVVEQLIKYIMEKIKENIDE